MTPAVWTYRWWAKTYGFTPKQVREEVDLDCFHWLPVIEEAIDKASERAQKAASAKESSAPTRRVLGR